MPDGRFRFLTAAAAGAAGRDAARGEWGAWLRSRATSHARDVSEELDPPVRRIKRLGPKWSPVPFFLVFARIVAAYIS